MLGQALRTLPRAQYLRSTKVGRYGHNGTNTWDYTPIQYVSTTGESGQVDAK